MFPSANSNRQKKKTKGKGERSEFIYPCFLFGFCQSCQKTERDFQRPVVELTGQLGNITDFQGGWF